ncbi:MAG TPA: F0F1 ATP synthase subunit A [Elusimicrobiota bacterium]|nr:F0F1 ATP synthase subunit A [Elusimicrobiota bacterium]
MNFTEILEHHLLDHAYFRLPAVAGVSLPVSKHVVMLWIAGALAVLFFVPVGLAARAGRRNTVVGMVEAVAVFVRDEIVLPNLGEDGRRYLPYFLSLFFFILFCNLLGMVPFGATATGNIAVTAALALTTFAMINLAGMRAQGVGPYVKNLVPHGLPVWLLPLMFPIEILGLVTKSFALCIRLFANMIAGHIVILAFMALIFLFGSVLVAPVSVAAAVGMDLLEIFVAFLQAYIFTLLSAIFIGAAVHPQH